MPRKATTTSSNPAAKAAEKAPVKSPPASDGRRRSRQPEIHPQIVAQDRQLVAHLGQSRHRPRGDLLAQRLAVADVCRDHHRSLILVARVDDRVELLEHPVGGALRADVVDVQQIVNKALGL